VSGIHPIRAKKARYFEDRLLTERVLSPPAPTALTPQPDDWSSVPPQSPAADLAAGLKAEDEANGGLRREPELPDHVAIAKETTPSHATDEFALLDDAQDAVVQQTQELLQRMRGVARQATMDPADDLGL